MPTATQKTEDTSFSLHCQTPPHGQPVFAHFERRKDATTSYFTLIKGVSGTKFLNKLSIQKIFHQLFYLSLSPRNRSIDEEI